MARTSPPPFASPLPLLSLFAFFFILAVSEAVDDSIHDVLRSRGLPPGILPKAVKSYTLGDNGLLEVFLEGPCLTKYDTRAYFESVIRGNLSYGQLTDLVGLTQEELFLWLPVKDIIVDDPSSGLILFDIVVAHKQLSLSLFEDPPECGPDDKRVPSLRSGFRRNVWKTEKSVSEYR
ncbi:hypothetical protein H6P81_007227 [Aristolochia fimbriata]|uniref:Uncharacterized protein n=1 Tax=Aristolochia fimbriata TaxID=158543 RepID=A0AAV7F434_ARIFI|nr:hypothetical protein H6P81_007227 [Aristolochia fimbriata]